MDEEKSIKKFFKKDVLRRVIVGLAGFVVILLVFGAGVEVGTMKARYSYRWAENYHQNFAGPKDGFFSEWRNFPRGEFINPHGVFGSIIKIDGNIVITKSKDDVEKTVLVSENTLIQKGRETIKSSDLNVEENIIVIGSPNEQGQIEAKLIRVMPDSEPMMFRR